MVPFLVWCLSVYLLKVVDRRMLNYILGRGSELMPCGAFFGVVLKSVSLKMLFIEGW